MGGEVGGYTDVSEPQTIKHVLKERNIAKYKIFVIKQFKQFDLARSAPISTLSASLCSSLAVLFPNTIRQQDQQSRLTTSLLCLKREHNPKQ